MNLQILIYIMNGKTPEDMEVKEGPHRYVGTVMVESPASWAYFLDISTQAALIP